MSGKVLITGMSNSGKTSLLKPLKNAFVVSRDGKPFSLPLPHVNISEYNSMDEFLDIIGTKLQAFEEKFGKSPDTIVFDSVSRIFTDIEAYCTRKYNGFEVWSNVNKEVNKFVEAVNELQEAGYNIVLIAHAVWDENAKRYIETCKGSFAKTGGFLSTVDYAINIDIVGSRRTLTHRGINLARTLLDSVPDKEPADGFNLQDYLDKIKANADAVSEQWSI